MLFSYNLSKDAKREADILPYRFPTSVQRHYERLTAFPEGFLVLGERQRVSRLVRATLSFSKKLADPIGAIRDFLCHYNLTRVAAFHG